MSIFKLSSFILIVLLTDEFTEEMSRLSCFCFLAISARVTKLPRAGVDVLLNIIWFVPPPCDPLL